MILLHKDFFKNGGVCTQTVIPSTCTWTWYTHAYFDYNMDMVGCKSASADVGSFKTMSEWMN